MIAVNQKNPSGDHGSGRSPKVHRDRREGGHHRPPLRSGKSTFLRCLNLLETPTARQIIPFHGQDITDPKDRHRRRCASRWAWCSSTSTCSQPDHPEQHNAGPGQAGVMKKDEA